MSTANDGLLSRREITGGFGLGVLASAIAAATVDGLVETDEITELTGESVALQDPSKRFAGPPFSSENQPWPGLVSKMRPRPDHGETSYKGNNRLLGRKALITGGDSGIGRAVAIAYAREGADVAINHLPDEESDAHEVVALVEAAGRKCVPIPGDLREESFCRFLVAEAVKGLNGLDIFVSNAARMWSHASILDLSSADFDWTMKTNIYAPFWLTKAAVPHLMPGSAIICTTSEQAYLPSANLFDYAQSKAANVNFVKSLAKQLAPRGIRVNGVAPGPFWTPLVVSSGIPRETVTKLGQGTVLGRPGQPVELAPIYVLLAAADASYITGQIYGATGGSGQP